MVITVNIPQMDEKQIVEDLFSARSSSTMQTCPKLSCVMLQVLPVML